MDILQAKWTPMNTMKQTISFQPRFGQVVAAQSQTIVAEKKSLIKLIEH